MTSESGATTVVVESYDSSVTSPGTGLNKWSGGTRFDVYPSICGATWSSRRVTEPSSLSPSATVIAGCRITEVARDALESFGIPGNTFNLRELS